MTYILVSRQTYDGLVKFGMKEQDWRNKEIVSIPELQPRTLQQQKSKNYKPNRRKQAHRDKMSALIWT